VSVSFGSTTILVDNFCTGVQANCTKHGKIPWLELVKHGISGWTPSLYVIDAVVWSDELLSTEDTKLESLQFAVIFTIVGVLGEKIKTSACYQKYQGHKKLGTEISFTLGRTIHPVENHCVRRPWRYQHEIWFTWIKLNFMKFRYTLLTNIHPNELTLYRQLTLCVPEVVRGLLGSWGSTRLKPINPVNPALGPCPPNF